MSCNAGDDYCSQIVSNPDVSGIGVRSAIYAQTLISMCISSFLWDNEKAFRDTCRNSYVVSGSLIISAIIAWRRDQLSLFDALITTMLTTMMTGFSTVNEPYIRTLGLSISFASLLFVSCWCYWGLQVWINVQKIGLPPGMQNCTANNNTQFVVFGRSIEATNHGLRGFALVMFGIGIASALWALYTTASWVIKYITRGPKRAKLDAAMELARWLELRNQRGRRAGYVKRFAGLGSLIYMIVTIEQMVARNPDVRQTLRVFSFGQTLALIMVTQQLLDFVSYARQTHRIRSEQRKLGSSQPYV